MTSDILFLLALVVSARCKKIIRGAYVYFGLTSAPRKSVVKGREVLGVKEK